MLCQFLLYGRESQLHVYIQSLYFLFFAHINHYRVLSTVPCAMQQVLLISYLLYVSVSQFIPPMLFPFVTLSLFSTLRLYFCFVNEFICTIFFRFQIEVISFICLSLSDLLSLTTSRSLHVGARGIISFFLWLNNSLLYVFLLVICQWTVKLLSCPGYCKQCCYEHWGTFIFLNYDFLWIDAQEWD